MGSLYSAPAGTYTWTTTAGNSPSGTPPSIGILVQGDFSSGVATKSVTLYKAESGVTFTANEPPSSTVGGTSGAITVNFGALQNYEVIVSSPQITGTCFTGTNTVKARDQWNNYVTNDSSTVTMSTSGTSINFYTNPGCSGATSTYTLASGVATLYIQTSVKQSGFTVTATNASITGISNSITVNAGTVTRLVITLPGQTFTDGLGNSGSITNRTAGSSFTITSISATDDFFNINTGYSGSKTLVYVGPANAPDSTPPSYTTAVSFTNGQSTTTLTTTLYKAETTTITATDGGNYGYASGSVTVDPGATVSSDAADSIVSVPASAAVGSNVSVTITLKDTWQNPKSGILGTDITFTGTSPTFSVISSPTTTDVNGVSNATLNWSDIGLKTVVVNVVGALPSSTLSSSPQINITTGVTTQSQMQGGLQIRGGSKIGQ